MKFKEQAKLLSAESNAYSFQGRDGVSHKVRLLIGDEIFSMRSSHEQVNDLKDLVGREGEATIEITSPKENLSAKLVSFEV